MRKRLFVISIFIILLLFSSCTTKPDELFMLDFEKYLQDKADLQHLINEANRKVNTYLKE